MRYPCEDESTLYGMMGGEERLRCKVLILLRCGVDGCPAVVDLISSFSELFVGVRDDCDFCCNG